MNLPDPSKPKGKHNNRKQTFDAVCRTMLFDISHKAWGASGAGTILWWAGVSGKAGLYPDEAKGAAGGAGTKSWKN